MKLGPLPLEIKAAAKTSTPSAGRSGPRLDEMGATGTQIFGGLVAEQDYNTKLRGPKSYEEYEKMRNDGQVKAASNAIKMPLLNADWFVEAASDSALDREIAERQQTNLMDGMTTTWAVTLNQALRFLDYGSLPMEPVWEYAPDGLIGLRKLAPRHPKTVQQWLVDEAGGLAGIRQFAWKSSKLTTVDIPAEKLVVFVNELEGSNWRGNSMLRSAWKHYVYKDGYERVQAIAIERRATGVDVGTLDGDFKDDPEKKRQAENVLMTTHAHEKNYVTEIAGQFAYRIAGVDGRTLDPQTAIDYHDWRILRSILAEFLGMGSGSTGSLAMHKDKSAFFMMALGAIANLIADTITRHLLRRWVDYNWAVSEYPRLRYSRLEVRDLVTWAEALSKLHAAGAIDIDDGIRREARSVLDVPPEQASSGTRAQRRPEPEPSQASKLTPVQARQIDRLVDVSANMYRRGETTRLNQVWVPFREERTRELEEEGVTRAESWMELEASGLRQAFINELAMQIKAGGFDPVRLRLTLIESISG